MKKCPTFKEMAWPASLLRNYGMYGLTKINKILYHKTRLQNVIVKLYFLTLYISCHSRDEDESNDTSCTKIYRAIYTALSQRNLQTDTPKKLSPSGQSGNILNIITNFMFKHRKSIQPCHISTFLAFRFSNRYLRRQVFCTLSISFIFF